MANEIELKLLVAPEDIERLLHHSVFGTVVRREVPPQQLLSVYYDTPDLDLKKHRIALRLRRAGNRWIQTVKTEGKVAGGLHERPEWEWETAEGSLNFSGISNPTVHRFFADEKMRHLLCPVFTTEFTRTSSLLEFAGGDVVELSVDQGEIRAGEQQRPICEVELEVKAGTSAHLFEIALALQETIPLRLGNVSKAERGYHLIAPVSLAPAKAQSIVLSKDLSASDVFVRILRNEMIHLQANEEGGIQGENPEFIHQMRVALRRMRSAFSIFSDIISKEKSAPLRTELRWLTRELDAARNWDVFVLDTLPSILAAFPGHQGLVALMTESEKHRHRQNLRASKAVTSNRYQRLLLSLGSWLCSQPWREDGKIDDAVVEVSATTFASRVLQKWHKRLKKKGKNLTTISPEKRHQVRIVAKKLRYAAEFFFSLYPHKRMRRYVAVLAGVQEVLGSLNDAMTIGLLLPDVFITENEVAQQRALDLVRGWIGGKSQAQLKDLEGAWVNFIDQKVFW